MPDASPKAEAADASAAAPDVRDEVEAMPVDHSRMSGQEYVIQLDKTVDPKLGLDVDTEAKRNVLPIRAITGGLVGTWNEEHPDTQVLNGDEVIEVNGVRGDAASLVDQCARHVTLRMVLLRGKLHD